jgi:import inner membrane translocase subunit TIM50
MIMNFPFGLLQYVDPVVERLDTNHFIRYRLSRSATRYQDGKHYRVCHIFFYMPFIVYVIFEMHFI